MNSAAPAIIAIVASVIVITFNVWLFIVGVQFLRVGTKAFRRYLTVTTGTARGTEPEPGPGRVPERGYS